MNRPQQARTLAAYNRWMNENLYAASAKLSDAQRKEDRGAFFKSVHGTLNHLLLADRVWMSRFTGTAIAFRSLDQELYSAFDELATERAATDIVIERWAADLTDADFERDLHYTSMSNPEPRCMPLALAITHFFNHQTHHRGQVTTLLSQCGINPGVTDLIAMPIDRRPTT